MPVWLIVIVVIVGIIVLFGAIIAGMYNSLVKLNERVEEAWSDITIQLKRRADMLPNLVETVKGYAKHEKEVFEHCADARAKMMGARTVQSVADADRSMLGALSRIMAVAENYPALQANDNFKKLMSEISDTEDKVSASRRFYNAGAKDLNTKIKVFPFNILFHSFKIREYYNVDEKEFERVEKAPEVKF